MFGRFGILGDSQDRMNHAARQHSTLRNIILAFIILPASTEMLTGQDRIMFDHLTVKDGLSQGVVICIFQDAQGFMWFGTQDGLNRYDGYSFRIFKNDPADSTSLADNFVASIAEDSAGTLWVGTVSNPGILNRFDRGTETFARIPKDSVDLSGARMSSSRMQYVDSSGGLWYGTRNGGLTHVDGTSGRTTVYTHDPGRATSIAHDDVFSVVGDPSGVLWVGTREGLDRFDPKTKSFKHFKHSDRDPKSLSDNYVWPLLLDRSGVLWIGMYKGGLNRFDRETGTFVHFRHNESDPRSLAGDRIYSLYQDRSGMIWVGTGDHGVDRFHPELSSFEHIFHVPGNPISLLDDNILSMTVSKQGIVWIGTRGGLDRWDRASGSFTHYRHDPSNPQSISDNQVQALLEDRTGVLWIGTVGGGLDRFDPRTGVFGHYKHDPSNSSSLSENRVYALCEDRSGVLWVGTYAKGLSRFDRKTQTFKTYVHDDSVGTSLGGPGVWALLEDHEGVLWVGTAGGGLDRFDRDAGIFMHFRHDESDPRSLSHDLVVCLFEDRAGTIWVGTAGGLNRFDRKTGMFQRYYEKDGLANDVVLGILEDKSGALWISTNNGLSRLSSDRKSFNNYYEDNGLQGNEFNQAYAQDRKSGEMFFGGPNGFNVFQPELVRSNEYVPPVVFTSFIRYNTDDAEGKPIEERGLSSSSELVFSYKDNLVNFELAALSYFITNKNRYAYRLQGLNDNWIHLGTERRASLIIPSDGEYVLQVKGSNNDGVWNEEGTALTLIVTPPWWKTNWAYGSYFILVVTFLYGVRRFENSQREQKTRIRESELHAKAVEAEKRALQAENERKTKELEDARRLQLSMLPREIPTHQDFEIAVFMKTATEVGGDYYDFRLSADGGMDVALGDATGHGMQAGALVTLMKGLFLSDSPKVEIPTFFNHCSAAIKQIKLGRLFMAFSLVRLKGNSVSLSSAGMPPVYLYKKKNAAVEEIFLKGMPLGAMKNFPYVLHKIDFEPGDTLLLITDGIAEQKNVQDEMFGYPRIAQAFSGSGSAAPNGIIEELVNMSQQWMGGAVQDDDMTLLVIRKKG